jgi:ferritin-like metal-binding protein YciE
MFPGAERYRRLASARKFSISFLVSSRFKGMHSFNIAALTNHEKAFGTGAATGRLPETPALPTHPDGARAMQTLKELFEETLKDVYFAEKAIIKALPKMAKKTKSPALKQAFEEHTEQTKGQVQRLDEIFKLLGQKSSGKECPALKGLVEETEELMSEAKSPDVLHAGLIGCAQAVEHYEIARYGTLRAWAEQLDMPEAVRLLEATLEEEKQTDEKLTKLAMGGINEQAEEPDAAPAKPKASKSAKPAAAAAASKPSTPAKSAAAKKTGGNGNGGSSQSGGAKTATRKK